MSDRAEQLFEQALGLESNERRSFVEEACRENPQLRDELLSLLDEAEDADQFFGQLGEAVFSSTPATYDGELQPDTGVADLHDGDVVGHYRILSFIGRGGMGAVYRAHDTRLDREVALKFLPAYLSADEDARNRLLIEARAVAALDHPNVCSVHEIGETGDGRLFIAMPFYGGETLKEKLRRERLSVKDSVDIAIRITRGLIAAHDRGIIHRDIKPGNIIVGSDGSVRILDFGLAMPVESSAISSGATPGTVAYMSPEQVRGHALDQRTDLWSLGVVLYEMLSGERPFRGKNAHEILHAILHSDPEPAGARDQTIGESLAGITDRLLQKDPEKRYDSATNLLHDLELSLSSSDSRGTLFTRRSSLIGTAALVAIMLVAIFGWRKTRDDAAGVTARMAWPSIAVLPFANLGTDSSDAALATGMTEELIGTLATAGDIRVIASTSVAGFRQKDRDVRKIADSLGVSNILEGGLRKDGTRVRFQVRLVNGRDGTTRWSQSYDREFKEMFAVQDEIARAVVAELDLRFDRDRQFIRHNTRNVVAYELYLRASDPVLLRNQSGIWRAQQLFAEAIAADSTYAASHAGLALVYVRRARNANDPGMPVPQLLRLAEGEARKAIAIDSTLAEGHYALGRVLEVALDFPGAEAAIRRAIVIDPTRSVYRRALSYVIAWRSHPEEELAEARRALETDPLNPYAIAAVASGLYGNRRYDEAIGQLQRLNAIQPPLQGATFAIAQCYAKKQMLQEAITTLRPNAEAGDPLFTALLGHMLARAGQIDEANRILADLKDRRDRTGAGAFHIAVVYAGLGNRDEAFAWLDKSIDDRTISSFIMGPTFDDLHRDARFELLRKRLRV